MASVKRTAIKRRKDLKHIERGQVHIHASFNNTIVTITDMNGGVISWSSAGKIGLKGSRKSTSFAAQLVSEDAAKLAKIQGMRRVEVYVKGPGQGRESAIRQLQAADLEITKIQDVSPIAHNGCRPPKRRRL
ncbi:MAG: 30S ribosomal protein S11 [Christensenellaceae bacterium]|jgi:small subunit ribosomal protein S11|nr:30S ribosomal protein S11 [Christensenellaceae bacterium]